LGFTLAEVLITLGIIGVVTVITISTVLNKIENRQNIAMWKKKYSEISQIYNLVKDEIGTPICVNKHNLSQQVKCRMIADGHSGYSTLSPEFVEKFVSHLNVIDSCSSNEAYGNTYRCVNYYRKWLGTHSGACSFYGTLQTPSPGEGIAPASCRTSSGKNPFWQAADFGSFAVLLSDGSVIYFGGYATGWISVDVNGFAKGPNVLGKDFFTVMVNDEWIKPLGADGTFYKPVNGDKCECSKDYGISSSQGFLGSSDLLHGRMVSGGCCSAVYLQK